MNKLLTIVTIASLTLGIPSIIGSNCDSQLYCNQEEQLQEEQEELKEPEEQKKEEKQEEKKKEEKKQAEPQGEQMVEPQQELFDVKEEIPEHLKYYKKSYEDTYKETFENVWNAVKSSLDECRCMIIKSPYKPNDEGFYKGSIISDFCVFTAGPDSTEKVAKRYSLKFPRIRGAVWTNARMQYKFLINESSDGTVHLVLKGELSGFEEYVTGAVQFWESNGFLETIMLERIKKNIQQKKQ